MCPNTPYLGGLWASCPLRYPRRCFSLGGSHFEGWDQAGGQSPGSLIVGASAQPPDQLLWRHLPFVLKDPVVGGWRGDQGTWKMGTALPWWVGMQEA